MQILAKWYVEMCFSLHAKWITNAYIQL